MGCLLWVRSRQEELRKNYGTTAVPHSSVVLRCLGRQRCLVIRKRVDNLHWAPGQKESKQDISKTRIFAACGRWTLGPNNVFNASGGLWPSYRPKYFCRTSGTHTHTGRIRFSPVPLDVWQDVDGCAALCWVLECAVSHLETQVESNSSWSPNSADLYFWYLFVDRNVLASEYIYMQYLQY